MISKSKAERQIRAYQRLGGDFDTLASEDEGLIARIARFFLGGSSPPRSAAVSVVTGADRVMLCLVSSCFKSTRGDSLCTNRGDKLTISSMLGFASHGAISGVRGGGWNCSRVSLEIRAEMFKFASRFDISS